MILRCSYCGKPYKVDNTRYEKAINGDVKNPTCSRACKDSLSSLVPRRNGGTGGIKAKGLF